MPAKFRKLVAALRAMGVTIEKPKSGSHWKARRDGFRPYPIPAHRMGAEVPDVYIRGVARALALDYETLESLL